MSTPLMMARAKTAGFSLMIFVLGYVLFGILFQLPSLYGIYEMLESFVYYQTFSSTAEPNENLIIIDERDVVYDRSVFAALIQGLDRQGAKVIGFDVLFAGGGNSPADDQLVEATRGSNSKVIHAAEFYSVERNAVLPERFAVRLDPQSAAGEFVGGIYGVALPFEELVEATSYLGNITSQSDIAGRGDQYFPLLIKYNDRIYPSMPLLAALKYLDYTPDSLVAIVDDQLIYGRGARRLAIPMDQQSQLLVNFIEPAQFSGKVMSVEQALKRITAGGTSFKDRLVLVGNSYDSQEQMKGPHFKNYPNLFVYATIVSQILNRQNIQEGVFASLLAGLFLVVAGLLWLFFIRSIRIKTWMFYPLAVAGMLIFSSLMIHAGWKVYVLLPLLVASKTFWFAGRIYRWQMSRIRTVFISYSSKDSDFARKLNDALERSGILTRIDFKMPAGKDLMQFIKESVRESHYTVLVVSKNSLDSEWVYAEFMETMIHQHAFETKKFLPVCIDTTVYDKDYQMRLIQDILGRLEAIAQGITQLRARSLSTESLEEEEKRLKEHQVNLDKMLSAINGALAIDLGDDEKFEKHLSRVVERIKGKKLP